MTSRLRARALAAASMVLAFTVCAACSSDPADPDDPTDPTAAGAAPTAASADPPGSATTAPQASGPLVEGWTSPVIDHPITDVARVGDGYVLTTMWGAVGLDPKGVQRWKDGAKDQKYASTTGPIVNGVVVRANDPRDRVPRRYRGTRILDAATGTVLWRDPRAPEHVTSSAIYYTRCSPGECAVERRDLRTGRLVWKAPTAPGLASVEVSGGAVVTTSYPHGTDRQPNPYTERTRAQTFDPRTGRPLGFDELGNSFREIGNLEIEESYLASRGSACSVTLIARTMTGRERWRRTFNWTLTPEWQDDGGDCALDPDIRPADGNRMVVRVNTRFAEMLDRRTGRTLWKVGPARRWAHSAQGVDVFTNAGQDTFRAFDSTTRTRVWTLPGEADFFSDEKDPYFTSASAEGFFLRSLATGDSVFEGPGTLIAHGDDWVATAVPGPGGESLYVFDWPH